MNYKNQNKALIICLLWLASLLAVGNFAYAQTGVSTNIPVEILMADPVITGSSESQVLFQQAKKYHDGNGVQQDLKRAHTLYLKAAGMGNNDARINLGYLYFMGEGVEQSYLKARNWYLSAANNGSKDAQQNLAMIYQNGFGVPKDNVQAEYWRTYGKAKPVKKEPLQNPPIQKRSVQKPVVSSIKKSVTTEKSVKPNPVQSKSKVKQAIVSKPKAIIPKAGIVEKPKPAISQIITNQSDIEDAGSVATKEPLIALSQEEQITLQAQILTPIARESMSEMRNSITTPNTDAVLSTPMRTFKNVSQFDNKDPQTLPQWVSNILAAIMLSSVLITCFWFFTQYSKIGNQKKARVFATAFYAHHRDRLRVNYLRYPLKHRKIDTMEDSWAAALCVLMVRFAQSQQDEDTLVGMQSDKIIQALKESPFKAKQAVFPFVKVTQHRIFDDIQAHECNFKEKFEKAEAPPAVTIKDVAPTVKIKEVLTVEKAKEASPPAIAKDVLESDCAEVVKLRSVIRDKQKNILSEDIPPYIKE